MTTQRDTVANFFDNYTANSPDPSRRPSISSDRSSSPGSDPFEIPGVATAGGAPLRQSPRSSDPATQQQPPLPTDTQWRPPPRGTSATTPVSSSFPQPGIIATSSAMPPRPPHLRERSTGAGFTVIPLGTDADEREGQNPFGDRFHKPQPFHAAMMEEGSESGHGHGAGVDRDSQLAHASNNMRGDRAEWLPTQQHLYSESSLAHDDAAARALRGSPRASPYSSPKNSSIGHFGGPSPLRPSPSSSSHGASSKARYDLASISPDVLYAYEKSRYTTEADDVLHDPGPRGKREGRERKILEGNMGKGSGISGVGFLNLLALAILGGGLVMLFAGYPVYAVFTKASLSNFGATGMGGINSTGQVPDIPGYRGLIDGDTPQNFLTRTGFDGSEYQLVFSDEFNLDGRTFYPGDDPYFEAVDLEYHATNNLEWYDPGNIYTEGGYLAIDLTKETNASSHGKGYLGGMLQSWNKFCFTGGYIEVAISLPGDDQIQGLWPAAWTMGNLGRAGYGGSLEGNWPYAYEACDVGTLANQTDGTVVLPAGSGDQYYEDSLSFLPGQRLSSCTCPGENHPGPILADGSFAARSAPEIDIFEATVLSGGRGGDVSQSAQWAPFNPSYAYLNDTASQSVIYDNTYGTTANTYAGGVYQQVTSGLSETDGTMYDSKTKFEKFGFEYTPSYVGGWGTGSILWTQGDEPMWRISDTAMAANAQAKVSNRVVTGEPLYILFNLGMSENFGFVDLENLVFPSTMRVDYVRVYQKKDQLNVGCSPPLYPTAEYIANNIEMYTNPNVTILAEMNPPQAFPKNRLVDTC